MLRCWANLVSYRASPLAPLLLATVTLSQGCGPPKLSPANSYRVAESSYQMGNFAEAQSKAEAGYERYLRSDPALAGRFRLLQERATLGLQKYELVVDEFASSPPQVFSVCDTSARRHMLEAFADANLGRQVEAALNRQHAELDCASPDPLLVADLAIMRALLGDAPENVEKDYLTALTIARQQHDSYRESGALLNLGSAALRQEHYDESIDLEQASLLIAKKMGYKLYEEKAEGNLAWAYYKVGDLENAMALATKAEEQARILGVGTEQIRWRNNMGLLREQSVQLALAEADYRQALTLAQQQGDIDQATVAMGELTLLSVRTGKWEEARTFAMQTLDAAKKDENRPMELQAMLAQGLIASQQGDQETAEKLLSEVAHDAGHDRQSLRWESQATLAELYAREKKGEKADAEYRAALETARQARCSIQQEELRMPFFANTTRLYDSYIDFLVQQGKTAEALRTADESRALTLAEGMGVEGKKCLASEAVFDPLRLAQQTKATILFYWLGTEHSYLWAIGREANGKEKMKLYPLPPSGQIEPVIQGYRTALTGSRDLLESGDASGEKLYETLIAPAAEFFHPDERVIVLTDGSLSGLSFETLIAPQPKRHYWIEDVTLENASSLRLLAAAQGRRAGTGGKLLLMGDALPPASEKFDALPHAAEEMRSVGKYFSAQDEQVYGRSISTASAYLASRPEQFAYIHFVAHGTANESKPLDSAVVLSPAQDGSYKLYGRDVIAHPLNAELVTVSACKSAGTRAYTGEGLVGLSWAFLHAGAHHVIGALWEISDEATPQLMDRMYAELVKGSSPDEALRQAKLAMLHSGQPFRKPYYWAAFQLYTGS